MSAHRVERWLAQEIGLDAASIGHRAVADAVRRRMELAGVKDEERYLAALERDPEEQQALIDAVVVPETWFFRDVAPFKLLGRWATSANARVLRVLSAPCASGEEAYSVAITLREAGLPPERYHVDAVDISHELLRRARSGVYGTHSFRGVTDEVMNRYFRPHEARLAVRDEVRRSVRFAHGNLLSADALSHAAPYDAILCRNLLIYENHTARERILALMDRSLKVDGLLFVGHAEALLVRHAGYRPVRESLTFAFRKGKHVHMEGGSTLNIQH